MISVIPIDQFVINHASHEVLLDTRSPAEYEHAHFPGAVSFPLMTNEQRAVIGTIYKQEGKDAAVLKGFELIGPQFAEFVRQANTLAPSKNVTLYCWRGGLRSSVMAWVLSTAGLKVTILKGGYKAFRQWVLSQFLVKKPMIIVGGKTGAGKTEMLYHLQSQGQFVIDLEKLAHHKGSAFGALGMPAQPSTEHFENQLALQWHKAPLNQFTWIENESIKIGKCALPINFFDQMREAICFELDVSVAVRIERTLESYGKFNVDLLSESTMKISKRLGGLRLKTALEALEQKDLKLWCSIVMEYYDKTYQHSHDKREKNEIIKVDAEGLDKAVIANEMIKLSKQVVL
ncbi:MAG: tRNA 2-selenouridine(34) synthase MnmH [Bacteroidia bacterium]|nr:tRNA 2-selenouridine(34) synthase MnmH [Bacteroidia bacterium]QQR94385.1 MAG: tRNA 2-selenouridine(34) synthase MnmH [Bacteroidota bacterium]MBP7713974.1 tRNA 2-selenouridine(34) synthase MnmH [Bacteroidia bacterium]MBP8667753.1 tRNA 2-selenouridine(34) synthase MnmH [Bacteroidia bacterium]HQW17024.1 tRNA 2-selenouridine(34) synthase MnmH [Bacteroidia bacterium]